MLRPAPQNIDQRLTVTLVSEESPIQKWKDRARESQREADELENEKQLGGSRMADRSGTGWGSRVDQTIFNKLSQVTEAERKLDLEAGIAAPGAVAGPDPAGPELKDRLRSTLASFSLPRAEPPGAQPSDAQPQPGDAAGPTGPDTDRKAE